jgi:hypothetical protein
MGFNPSSFKGEANLPVECVSWEDAQQFIKKLNARNDGYIYRLPTEAEWEYACRAGTSGDFAGNLDKMAWYNCNSGNKTHPTGQKKVNDWGLYDMHGNVWEWCADWYDENYYAKSPDVDPQGAHSGATRVMRGGGWFYEAAACRSAMRDHDAPNYRFHDCGIRLVRTYGREPTMVPEITIFTDELERQKQREEQDMGQAQTQTSSGQLPQQVDVTNGIAKAIAAALQAKPKSEPIISNVWLTLPSNDSIEKINEDIRAFEFVISYISTFSESAVSPTFTVASSNEGGGQSAGQS